MTVLKACALVTGRAPEIHVGLLRSYLHNCPKPRGEDRCLPPPPAVWWPAPGLPQCW